MQFRSIDAAAPVVRYLIVVRGVGAFILRIDYISTCRTAPRVAEAVPDATVLAFIA